MACVTHARQRPAAQIRMSSRVRSLQTSAVRVCLPLRSSRWVYFLSLVCDGTCSSCAGSPTSCVTCANGLLFQTGGAPGICASGSLRLVDHLSRLLFAACKNVAFPYKSSDGTACVARCPANQLVESGQCTVESKCAQNEWNSNGVCLPCCSNSTTAGYAGCYLNNATTGCWAGAHCIMLCDELSRCFACTYFPCAACQGVVDPLLDPVSHTDASNVSFVVSVPYQATHVRTQCLFDAYFVAASRSPFAAVLRMQHPEQSGRVRRSELVSVHVLVVHLFVHSGK